MNKKSRYRPSFLILSLMAVSPMTAHALSPSPVLECCNGSNGPQCAQFNLTPERCEAARKGFEDAQRGWEAQAFVARESARHAAMMQARKTFIVDSTGEAVMSGAGGKVERAIKE